MQKFYKEPANNEQLLFAVKAAAEIYSKKILFNPKQDSQDLVDHIKKNFNAYKEKPISDLFSRIQTFLDNKIKANNENSDLYKLLAPIFLCYAATPNLTTDIDGTLDGICENLVDLDKINDIQEILKKIQLQNAKLEFSREIFHYVVRPIGDESDEIKKIGQWLIAEGYALNKQDSEGNTPLHLALSLNKIDTAIFLMDNGSNPNQLNNLGRTGLSLLFKYKKPDVFLAYMALQLYSYLFTGLEARAIYSHPKFKPDENTFETIARFAAEGFFQVSIDLIEIAKNHNVSMQNLNTFSVEDKYPLHYAVLYDKQRVVTVFLDNSADINIKSIKGGNTPLHYAATNNNSQMVQLLINRGANTSPVNKLGKTPADLTSKNKIKELLNNNIKSSTTIFLDKQDGALTISPRPENAPTYNRLNYQ